jgi:acetyl esterase
VHDALRPAEPHYADLTPHGLIAHREAENRFRASSAARTITGEPEPGVTITWERIALTGRRIAARVYRANSHFAARLPAVVVSVEHRLLDFSTTLSAAVDDGWDVLERLVLRAAAWGIDPDGVTVVGESCGALIAALAAIRAKAAGLQLRSQVLVPAGADARTLSPLYADDLAGLAGALVVPTHDPLADHGRRYAARLQAAGTPTRLVEYPSATNAFLSMPGVAPQAAAARADILQFLRGVA